MGDTGPNDTVLMKHSLRGEEIRRVFFIGIGGIGMSALARYFQSRAIRVDGYDKTATPLTKELEDSGMSIQYGENEFPVPEDVDLVVYTPAVPATHRGLSWYREKEYKIVKRSDVLQLITESSFNICIAGTHGKTTITTMVAHLLRHSGYGCNAFLGGISVNYGTNFWSHERNLCVIEADEYDRSFLKLSPDIAVITSMDADHLDIYGTAREMEDSFIAFSGRVKPGGILVRHEGLPREQELKGDHQLVYGSTTRADLYATGIRIENGSYHFGVKTKKKWIGELVLHMGGGHNVENMTAAIGVADEVGIEEEKIRAAVESFRGVKRRFEYIVKKEGQVYIDDYAHHPEELRALLQGTKQLFAGKKCTILFQPHLYSRTRDHAQGFAEVLGMADEVVLLPIYPARELPIEGVSSEMILERMKGDKQKSIKSKADCLRWIEEVYRKENGDKVLITAGAGDIDTLIRPIKELLENSY